MPQNQVPEGFAWLAQLAEDVNVGGYFKNTEVAAIYCAHCDTIQPYCTGCGNKLYDVYDENTDSCGHCGILLTHCNICGNPVTEMDTAPEGIQKPEYWKYCPACGKEVFAVTDMCPHCKVSMGTHLDAVYEATYAYVSQVVHEEEDTQYRMEYGIKPRPDRRKRKNINLFPIGFFNWYTRWFTRIVRFFSARKEK